MTEGASPGADIRTSARQEAAARALWRVMRADSAMVGLDWDAVPAEVREQVLDYAAAALAGADGVRG